MDLLLIVLLAGGAMYFMSRNTRKRQKAAAEFRDSLSIGDDVMTASGMLGTVVEIDGDTITIESVADCYSRWLRAAISPLPPTLQGETDQQAESSHEPGEDAGPDTGEIRPKPIS